MGYLPAEEKAMKKIYYLLFIILIFTSCKKSQEVVEEEAINTPVVAGLPGNSAAIHAYLYTSAMQYKTDSIYNYLPMRAYAVFSDPARDLMKGYNHRAEQVSLHFKPEQHGNVDVGFVRRDTVSLIKNTALNRVSYSWAFQSGYATLLPPPAIWSVAGNKTFLPVKTIVSQGFPIIKMQNIPGSFSKSSGFTLSLNGFNLYDTLVVKINNNTTSINFKTEKIILPHNDSVKFEPSELASIPVGSQVCSIELSAYSYFHQTINNKLFIYEFHTYTAMKLLQVNP